MINIMGIMAAIVIAFIGGTHREAMEEVKNRRNAQEMASLYMVANVAGVDFTVPGDLPATVNRLLAGEQAVGGAFHGRIFRMGALQPGEISGAMAYLKFNQGMLQYMPAN